MIDYSIVATLSAWTVALVAASRKVEPRIDGWLVFVVAAIAALLGAFALCEPSNWIALLQHASLAWVGAIGSVQFADRAIDRMRR